MKEEIINERINDQFILNYFYSSPNSSKINGQKTKNIPADIQKYLDERFLDSESNKETIMRIKYGQIEERPKCVICGKPVRWYGHKSNYLFFDTCSHECEVINRKKNIKSAVKEKYGVDNVFQLETVKEKNKETWTNKYGVDNPRKCEIIKEKCINTCLQRYGMLNGGGTEQSLLKAQHTCLNRYGVTNYSKTEEFRKWNSEHMLQKEVQQRIYTTRKKNNTFNSSKQEDKLHNLLINKFGENNIIRQYKSTDYPYNCDFYVKPLNLYIEYQGSWLHGFHPYNHNDEKDLERVAKLKEKSNNGKNMYEHAITVWTEIDVKKRETAKKNNLNYLEIFWKDNLNDIVNNL